MTGEQRGVAADGGVALPPDYPQSIAQLARTLGVHRRTLQRALDADPKAPAPDVRDDLGRRLYRLQPVAEWWPNRRSRGRPSVPTGVDEVKAARG